MQNFARWLTRGCEFIAAIILAAIFIIFLLQIFARYTSKIAWMMPIEQVSNWMLSVEPLGWTLNLISLLWVWLIFFGCSFVVRERDHVTFDILYLALPDHLRRIAIIIVSLTMIFALLWSFLPTWDAIFGSRLMELKKIQTLRIPVTGDKIQIKWLFASYITLMIVVLLRYTWICYEVSVKGPPKKAIEELSGAQKDNT
jgi:C4-dicarboxylate transporter DctQ subunit|tara:strand:+ start:1199 stop:1795 length:597 start_codon:yes stop_codon:yes gene_type:complete